MIALFKPYYSPTNKYKMIKFAYTAGQKVWFWDTKMCLFTTGNTKERIFRRVEKDDGTATEEIAYLIGNTFYPEHEIFESKGSLMASSFFKNKVELILIDLDIE
jgi:hypothetical protein